MVYFTIAIPFYNAQEYLVAAIESCLHQQGSFNYELLLINDGSQDASLSLAQKFEYCFPDKVRLINLEKNQGVGAARQLAVEHARGEYIVWADGDDIQHPNRLNYIKQILDRFPDTEVLLHNCFFINAENKPIQKELFWPKKFAESPLFYEMRRNYFFVGFSAQKKGINIPFRNKGKDFPEDYDFFLRALLAKKKFYFTPEKLSYYRLHGKNRSYNYSGTVKASQKVLMEAAPDLMHFLANDPGFTEKEKRLALSEFLVVQEKFTEALEHLSHVNLECFESHFLRGVCRFLLKDYTGSAQHFSQAYQYDQNEPSVQNNLAILKFRLGEVDQAMDLFSGALAKKPDYLDAQENVYIAKRGKPPSIITRRPLRRSWVY